MNFNGGKLGFHACTWKHLKLTSVLNKTFQHFNNCVVSCKTGNHFYEKDPWVFVTECVWPVLHISDWYGNNLTSRCFICLLVKLQVPHFHPSLNMNFQTTQYSRLTMTLSNKGQLVTHTHTHTHKHRLKPKYAGSLYETRDICSFQSPHLRDLDERPCHKKQILFFKLSISSLRQSSSRSKIKPEIQFIMNAIKISFKGSWLAS